MITLYIDTSSSFLYTGIVKDSKIISQFKQELGKDMSTFALQRIIDMIKKSKLDKKEINKIIVVNGPGSFTGIRIGITIAKTFAWSLNTDITTISSLDAMSVSTPIDSYKIPVLDARREFVYAGIYDSYNNVIMENQYISLNLLETAAETLNDKYTYITNDNIDIKHMKYEPNILKIVEFYKDKENINPHSVNPIYLKKTEAEENKGIECI